jgi:hypothetical protein
LPAGQLYADTFVLVLLAQCPSPCVDLIHLDTVLRRAGPRRNRAKSQRFRDKMVKLPYN